LSSKKVLNLEIFLDPLLFNGSTGDIMAEQIPENHRGWIERLPAVVKMLIAQKDDGISELSEKYGFYRVFLSKLVHGHKKFGLKELADISYILGVSEEELIKLAKKNSLS
jgi:hypothetical protein